MQSFKFIKLEIVLPNLLLCFVTFWMDSAVDIIHSEGKGKGKAEFMSNITYKRTA